MSDPQPKEALPTPHRPSKQQHQKFRWISVVGHSSVSCLTASRSPSPERILLNFLENRVFGVCIGTGAGGGGRDNHSTPAPLQVPQPMTQPLLSEPQVPRTAPNQSW